MKYASSESSHTSVTHVGRARSPLIRIDDFIVAPGLLVESALTADFIDAGSNYPGVRAPAPQAYVRALLNATAPLIEQVFGAPPEDELDLCAFSIVTMDPVGLHPTQRIPHFDGPEVHRIAYLHYLCEPEQGGTSFYRHHASGLEAIHPADVEDYRARLAGELRVQPPPAAYANGDTPLFARIHSEPAAFNRLLIYKGNVLHSGDVGPETVLSEDPRCGRLTINGFGFLRS